LHLYLPGRIEILGQHLWGRTAIGGLDPATGTTGAPVDAPFRTTYGLATIRLRAPAPEWPLRRFPHGRCRSRLSPGSRPSPRAGARVDRSVLLHRGGQASTLPGSPARGERPRRQASGSPAPGRERAPASSEPPAPLLEGSERLTDDRHLGQVYELTGP